MVAGGLIFSPSLDGDATSRANNKVLYLCCGGGEAWTLQKRVKLVPAVLISFTSFSLDGNLGTDLPTGSWEGYHRVHVIKDCRLLPRSLKHGSYREGDTADTM